MLHLAALVGVLSATIVEFNKVEPSAAKLLMPYLGWTLFASALTYNIWAANTDKKVSLMRYLDAQQ